jgi:hypothetical protein
VRSSPERRRLRFSFQINNVKDPEPKLPEPPSGGTTRLAPDVGGGGYLSNLEFRVKPFFNKTVRTKPPNQPKGQSNNPKPPSKENDQSSQEESFKKLSRPDRETFKSTYELFPDPPEPRFLLKAKPRVNRPFPSLPMLWPRPLRRTRTG